jgi:ice-binding like protein
LTLNGQGNSNAVWIFKIGAALTGTNFTVVMANGAQPCNVFWAPSAAATMTDSAFKGNILAGGATGSITLTRGAVAGRALANVAVTMTGTSVIGCTTLAAPPPAPQPCVPDDDDDDKDKKDHKKGREHHRDRD